MKDGAVLIRASHLVREQRGRVAALEEARDLAAGQARELLFTYERLFLSLCKSAHVQRRSVRLLEPDPRKLA